MNNHVSGILDLVICSATVVTDGGAATEGSIVR